MSNRRKAFGSKRQRLYIRLVERDGLTCHYCHAKLASADMSEGWAYHAASDAWMLTPGYRYCHIDHVIPMSRGGSDDLSNLVLSCSTCNEAKGAK
jgi:5-methylcytosine-specific restriction endonuclease McrA